MAKMIITIEDTPDTERGVDIRIDCDPELKTSESITPAQTVAWLLYTHADQITNGKEVSFMQPDRAATNQSVGIDPASGCDETGIEVRIPSESATWTFGGSEVADLCAVIAEAIKKPGTVTVLIRKGAPLPDFEV